MTDTPGTGTEERVTDEWLASALDRIGGPYGGLSVIEQEAVLGALADSRVAEAKIRRLPMHAYGTGWNSAMLLVIAVLDGKDLT